MRYALMGLLFVLAACQPVKETSQLAEQSGAQLQAKPGDTVLTIVKEKNLPSEIIKGADVLGRKTMTGLTTLEYRGVEGNRAVFKQRTMLMASNATDLNPSRKPSVMNEGDKNIYVNLSQANRKVVVEQRTLLIARAGSDGLVYSIIDTRSSPVAPKSAPVKEAAPSSAATVDEGDAPLKKPQWETDFLNFITMGNAS